MASLENLPSDQRAVLDLVLRRGRSYDEIAGLLSIDRAGVRERALAAFDALGPDANVPPERRALITDYLLGQLPARVAEDTRRRLGESPSERAWARVVASELAPIAGGPLPEIPVVPVSEERAVATDAVASRSAATPPEPASEPTAGPGTVAAAAEPQPSAARDAGPAGRSPRSSRRGGAILLAAAAVIVVAAIVVVLVTTGGSSKPKTTASHGATTATTHTGTTGSVTPLAQINLVSPGGGSKTAGVAVVIRQGTLTAIAIRAQNVPANTHHNAYAVWLSNAPTDSVRLGFVNPSVGSNGVLQALGQLPTNAAHFKQVLVTLETTQNPRTPGPIVLEGTLSGV